MNNGNLLKQLIREVVLLVEASGIDEAGARELLKKFPKGMRQLGIDVSKADSLPMLGVGTHGVAFAFGPNKVLKVTDDAKEAQAASVLQGKDVANIVKVFNVLKFGDTGMYGVVQEKLKPLPAAEGEAFNKALVATGLPIWIKRAEGSWDKVKQLTKQYVTEQIKKKFKDLASPEAKEYANNVNEQWNALVTKYRLRDLFGALTELGIDFHDYHAGNMMQRDNGTLVLIDLGMSRIKGTGQIQTINQFAG